jgi:non-specific serine/threonine protein kinase
VLDFHVSLTLDGETLSEKESKQILRSEEGLVQIRGRWAEVDRDKLQTVLGHWRTLEKAHREEGISFAEGLRLLSGVREDSEDADSLTAWSNVRAGDWLEKTLSELRSPEGEGDHSPPGLRASLRPYQRAGVHWLRFLTRLRLGACLADDMGLGKTIQVLGMLLHWRAESPAAPPALLILPASLLGNWLDEAKRFAPSCDCWPFIPLRRKSPIAPFRKSMLF